jgi:hypothetical protein
MSSGSSGRYQSRLFNFLHQQSLKVKEQYARAFRNIQVSTKWTVEAILYPFYKLFQSVAQAGKQLGTSTPPNQQQQLPNATDSDTPIQQVLLAIATLPDTEEPKPSYPLAFLASWRLNLFKPTSPNKPTLHQTNTLKQNRPQIRAIASQISTHTLVLVTPQNQILDILTPQQQQILEGRILDEIANYWRAWRLAAETSQQTPQLLPSFGKLKNILPSKPENPSPPLLNPSPAIATLDAVLAKIETEALPTIAQASGELIDAIQNQLNLFFDGKDTAPATSQDNSSNKIQDLIRAAIEYFFGGNKRDKKLASPTTTTSVNPTSTLKGKPRVTRPQLPTQTLADPWLDKSDLFGDSSTSPQAAINQRIATNPALPANPTAGDALQNIYKQLRKYSPKPQTETGLAPRQKQTRSISKHQQPVAGKVAATTNVTESRLVKTEIKSNRGEISFQQRGQTTGVEAQPDYIDTKAQKIEYVKHPLEQMLSWLDNSMLWVEEVFMKIWRYLQRVLTGR